MRKAFALLSLLVFASGCDEDFKPASWVDKLRVLAARAQPAEIRPGQVTALDGLVVDPSSAAKPTVFWVACDPDPFNQGRTACTDTANFEDPGSLDLSSGALPEGMHFIGLGDRAGYAAPATLFDVLEKGDSRRIEGTAALVLMIAVGEEVSPLAPRDELAAVFARVRSKETQAVVALFRVQVSESAAPNQNPEFAFIHYGEDEPPPGAHLLWRPDEVNTFVVAATDPSYEAYRQITNVGTEDKVERVQVAWFATGGKFSVDRLALDSEIPESYQAPGYAPQDPVPPDRRGMTWAVLRDSRGGLAWREQPFFMCDPQLPKPVVRTARGPAVVGDPVVLEGDALESVVDVLLNGMVVKGSFSAARATWEGVPKGVAKGTWPLELRSADCSKGPDALMVTIP